MWWHDVVVTGAARTVSVPGGEQFDPKTVLGPKGLRYKDRASRLGMSAALLALEEAGVAISRTKDGTASGGPGDASCGVVVSSNRGNLDTVCRAAAVIREQTVAGASPMDLPNASPNVVASSVAIRFGLKGPNVMLCSGADSGLEAVRAGAVMIGSGRADRVVVVGVEPANEVVARLLGVAESACFDGAAAVVLERRAGAGRHGSRPLARLAGWRRAASAERAAAGLPGETAPISSGFGDASGALGVLDAVEAARSIHAGAVEAARLDGGVDGESVLSLALERDGGAR
ncbi:hypothetical protein GCM10027447_37530 [Glycomyces halotolerans]